MTAGLDGAAARIIDPLAPLVDNQYRDALVTVLAAGTELPIVDTRVVRTESFELWRHGWQLVLRHRVPDRCIDDSLTTRINEELFIPGWVSGTAVYESIFTGVVLTTRPDPLDAWVLFYKNTILHYQQVCPESQIGGEQRASQALFDFVAIHRHADALVPSSGSVLEIGACFGFLSLYLARIPARTVTASDIAPGTMGLLAAVADRLGIAVTTSVADAARIPRPDNSIDVVLLIHLLEHLQSRHGQQAVDEALRVAASRVVIAVPYEREATIAYGHVRTIDQADLRAWGENARDWTYSIHQEHGGWLVLDRR